MRTVELLGQFTDHDRARGVGKSLELTQVLLERLPRARALQRRADEERPLDWGRKGDQVVCDGMSCLGGRKR